MSKRIPLTQGKFVIVDDEDYKSLASYRWFYALGYAVRSGDVHNGELKQIRMHRVISRAKGKEQVDHINRDTLDNRRSNLRICTPSQNAMNRKAKSGNTIGFKGVRMRKEALKKPFTAQIKFDGRLVHLGFFETSIEAAKAYNEAAIKHFGDFANLNKV